MRSRASSMKATTRKDRRIMRPSVAATTLPRLRRNRLFLKERCIRTALGKVNIADKGPVLVGEGQLQKLRKKKDIAIIRRTFGAVLDFPFVLLEVVVAIFHAGDVGGDDGAVEVLGLFDFHLEVGIPQDAETFA